ncbi:HAD family phosphatase [Nonomuraea salmonea]|uniref:HAD family phosphatase n=1 Tax=Nonomuraea salmonea TaxID=46181 RepID=UPI002FE81D01
MAGESFWEAYWACRPPYDAGQDGTAYWTAVADRLGVRFADIPALIAADLDSWCHVDPAMVELIHELADRGAPPGAAVQHHRGAGARLGVPAQRVARSIRVADVLVPGGGWRSRIRGRTRSARSGWGVAPGEVLFIDDREENVVAARAAGMKAEVFVSAEQVRKLAGAPAR